jgi:hypothetical protein
MLNGMKVCDRLVRAACWLVAVTTWVASHVPSLADETTPVVIEFTGMAPQQGPLCRASSGEAAKGPSFQGPVSRLDLPAGVTNFYFVCRTPALKHQKWILFDDTLQSTARLKPVPALFHVGSRCDWGVHFAVCVDNW